MSTCIESPFRISVADKKIQQLKQKLALTVFPDELEDAGRDYGVPLTSLRRLVTRWKDGDIEVDGHGTLNIHYVHKKSEVADAIPLLFIHGWPGSIVEVRKILPLLIQASPITQVFMLLHSAFQLWISEAPKKKGFALQQCAEVGHKLMLALGYNEYDRQEDCLNIWWQVRKAWHTNIPLAAPPHPIHRPWLLLTHFLWGYSQEEKDVYSAQTLGYSLADSPAGLLAWIYEKLVNWTDNYPWNDDEVLTWISIYWFSRAGPAASIRIYYETFQTDEFTNPRVRNPTIPTGYSYFPKEIVRLPRRWLTSPYLVFESKHTSGGHFAAHEKPEELVEDLRKMFRKGGPAHFAVSGKIACRL
ncbi:Alpha/Beta hydrolase protein [Cyathus striatus]|nr:Alpha/Beta hydrolase protein [Cyathus striatus]